MLPEPEKIALFLPSLIGGGAERVMLNLAGGFAQRGYPVDLLLAASEGPYLQEVPEAVRIVDLAAGRVRASILPLAGYLRRQRPDFLLCALDHANCAAIFARDLARVRTRVALTLHTTPSGRMQRKSRLHHYLELALIRHSHGRAEQLIAVSAGVAEDYVQLYQTPAEKIRVIYNPVLPAVIKAKADQPLNHPWFAAGEPPVIIAVGRLIEQKDFATLITAFARVRASGTRCRLLILGEGPLRPALEAQIEQLGLQADIALPGFVNNPFAYLARARIFVLSSQCEGLPTVLIEALVVGTPVIATNCRSGPVEILEGGKYGPLVPIEDAESLAAAMRGELAKERQRPQAAAWERFTLGPAVDNYLECLGVKPLIDSGECR